MLEPTTSDPPYVPLSDSESSRNDESVIGLELEEAAAPTTADETACLEEMDRALPIHANVKKMCNRSKESMVMGSTAMVELLKGNPKR